MSSPKSSNSLSENSFRVKGHQIFGPKCGSVPGLPLVLYSCNDKIVIISDRMSGGKFNNFEVVMLGKIEKFWMMVYVDKANKVWTVLEPHPKEGIGGLALFLAQICDRHKEGLRAFRGSRVDFQKSFVLIWDYIFGR